MSVNFSINYFILCSILTVSDKPEAKFQIPMVANVILVSALNANPSLSSFLSLLGQWAWTWT